jgi:hypothetical protein
MLSMKVLVMSIIFAKETMGPSLTFSVLHSSQKFTPQIIKYLNFFKLIFNVIKILIFVSLDVNYGHPLLGSITLDPPPIHM